MRPADADVIAAIATPPGRGGIGIVRVSGRDLSALVEGIVGGPLTPRVATSVTFRDAEGDALDRGIALFFPSPASYTGENVLELQGHGGPAVLSLVLKRCLDLGARVAEPGEFTKRAYLNDKIDLAQAEAVADVISATTAAGVRAATRSLVGEFSREVGALLDRLVDLRVFIEATLDFPEEDIAFVHAADVAGKIRRLQQSLDALLGRSRQGRLLLEGLQVVLIGQPNVGKSSLLNQLVGEDRAIVTPVAGTTRDAIRSSVEIDGIPLHIIDTAGLRETSDAVEQVGIARTWSEIERADLALVVTDARMPQHAGDTAIIGRLQPALPRLVVRNKIDLAGLDPRRNAIDGADEIWLSAKTGSGVELLRRAILELAGAEEHTHDAFLARERHLRALAEARESLARAAAHLAPIAAPALELCAEELRQAHDALGEITGAHTADDLLREIFGRFCIGK
ncbi:MAG: tRNA uridine-5-carboxymethylaminomethyl(34) synthesis GTPase MnmE [Pseudomonadota bacterium]|nr:tRNA uridine-5-carboxymethylaminomethyl(34) synthesis GTPase MnmE [Pseudomonadota bacterium]